MSSSVFSSLCCLTYASVAMVDSAFLPNGATTMDRIVARPLSPRDDSNPAGPGRWAADMAPRPMLLLQLALALRACCGSSSDLSDSDGSGATMMQWMSGREVAVSAEPPPWDPKGYVIAFACQGRFGNQFDYLLGTLDYAKKIDRTLVLVRCWHPHHDWLRSLPLPPPLPLPLLAAAASPLGCARD